MSNVNEQVGLSDTQLASCTTLSGLLEALKRGDDNPAPWLEEGLVSQISEEAYFEYLEMLPPRWMRGSSFIYAEGSNAFLLCWQAQWLLRPPAHRSGNRAFLRAGWYLTLLAPDAPQIVVATLADRPRVANYADSFVVLAP